MVPNLNRNNIAQMYKNKYATNDFSAINVLKYIFLKENI